MKIKKQKSMIVKKDPAQGSLTSQRLKLMAEGGRKLAEVLKEVKDNAKVGVSTLELDQLAELLIKKRGAEPSFKMVPGYKFATCMCVNQVVVHGLPSRYKLKKGDILGIDIGLYYQGFHTDCAWTVIVDHSPGLNHLGKSNFLRTGKEALKQAIRMAKVGNHVGHISRAIQEVVEREGYSPVQALVGHGIGKNLHEDPPIPCFLKGEIEETPLLKEGMTLAIEVIYNKNKKDVVYKDKEVRLPKDKWTIQTLDKGLSGLFEQTVVVTKNGPIVLTK